MTMAEKRYTPENIRELGPGEVCTEAGRPAVQGHRRYGQCNPAPHLRRHSVQIIPEVLIYSQRLRRAMEGGRRLLQREPRFLTKPKGTAGVEMPGE